MINDWALALTTVISKSGTARTYLLQNETVVRQKSKHFHFNQHIFSCANLYQQNERTRSHSKVSIENGNINLLEGLSIGSGWCLSCPPLLMILLYSELVSTCLSRLIAQTQIRHLA